MDAVSGCSRLVKGLLTQQIQRVQQEHLRVIYSLLRKHWGNTQIRVVSISTNHKGIGISTNHKIIVKENMFLCVKRSVSMLRQSC